MKPLAILPLLAILIGSTGFHASVDAGAPVDEAIEEQDASVSVRKPSEAIKVCQVGYLVAELPFVNRATMKSSLRFRQEKLHSTPILGIWYGGSI